MTDSRLADQPAGSGLREPLPPLYRLEGTGKEYDGPGEKITILRGIDLDIERHETIAVVGASGSGKSSLLHLLGTLATSSWGRIWFQGRDMAGMTPEEKARLRNEEIGFVFQFHHLLPEFTTLENVAMPAIIAGLPRAEALARAADMLSRVGLGARSGYNVTLLSGGERQRAAIARALVRSPRVLLADEPTGNLDEGNGRLVADLLLELHARMTMAMVVVTHNLEIAARMDRCFELKSGDLYEQAR
ncbi:MAG: ABC transporter ATP-binding protein [Desulfovibrio sp.]|jgi:lipoprotein-releasing system ATP-binding protein|nr:ABC transporter ATP-binding protein [Desulfovibrio sp.]